MGLAAEFQDVFAMHADRVCLIDYESGSELAYGPVFAGARRMAAELSLIGVGRGHRVALMVRNTPECVLLELGCLFLGATMVPLSPDLAPRDVDYILGIIRPDVIVCTPSTRELASSGAQRTWELVPQAEGGPPVASLCETSDGLAGSPKADEDVVTVHFTSGTTSRPKGVPHRLGSLLRNAKAFNEAVGVGPDHRFMHVFQMSYMAGFLNTLICPLVAGASVVVAPVFDARSMLRFWRPAIRHEVNALWMSPTMLASLLRVDRDTEGKEYVRSRIHSLYAATAPLPDAVRRDFEHEYRVEVLNSYGLSELLIVAVERPGRARADGSVGRVLAGVDVELDGGGKEGELLVRTPDATPGYMTEAGEIPSSGREWFATGDLGRLEEGAVFVTGRQKDLIIRGGFNVSPQAVEEVLLRHPVVDEVAVVGLPHELYGEEVAAAVKLTAGHELTDELASLRAWCDESLAHHARPTRFFAVPSLPVAATGKVQKGRLRDILLDGHAGTETR